jgi:DNA-nicking Smr family endonuclease
MSRTRRPGLSEEDRRLWDEVRRTAIPLRPEAIPAAPAARAAAEAASPEPKASKAGQAGAHRLPQAPAAGPPPVGSIDRKTLTRLSRGTIEVEARIDLHGLTQSAAHHRLLRFLAEAQEAGTRIVLVITGKGAPGEATGTGEAGRGVLRRAVPGWLESASFRRLVSGYEPAGRRHGGGGALYVRVRRKRP